MKENIKQFFGLLVTLWLLYIGVKYLYLFGTGEIESRLKLILGVVALAIAGVRIKRYNDMRKFFNYLGEWKPLFPLSLIVLKENDTDFIAEVAHALKNKELYLKNKNGKKYYTQYIEDDQEKANKRYLLQAKEKDIKILERDGLNILDYVSLNYHGNDLEDYFFDTATEQNRWIDIEPKRLQQGIISLLQFYNKEINFDYIQKIENTYKQNQEKYYLEHESALSYNRQVWKISDIELYKQSAKVLKKAGFIFYVACYKDFKRGYGIAEKSEYKELVSLKMNDICFITVEDLMTQCKKERFYTRVEDLFRLLEKYKMQINASEQETIYIFNAISQKRGTLSKVGGVPAGVNSSNYPMYGDESMQHIWTLDLEEIPLLQERYKGIRAISLYVSSYEENEAYEIMTQESKVMFLTQKDIDAKSLDITLLPQLTQQSIEIIPIQIPKNLLKLDILKLADDSMERELERAIYNNNYIGGSPRWMQNEDRDEKGFICQFDESIDTLDDRLNLATGIMYVYEDDAYWQCG